MAITMQGAWNVQVKSKSAAFAQRFVIHGSDSADGAYEGVAGEPAVFVTGAQWSILIEHKPIGSLTWKPSADRLTTPKSAGGMVSFDILSNDTGGDRDYNDLILTCSMPTADSEYVIYGKVTTYSGACRLNPCSPHRYAVVDTAEQLKGLLQYRNIAAEIAKWYPQRVKRVKPKVPPRPDPPDPFRPMMIPLGAAEPAGVARYAEGKSTVMVAAAAEPKSAGVLNPAGREFAKVIDKYRPVCSLHTRPGLLLQFLEYDRTADEMYGGAYEGDGNRQPLGLAVTDEQGNYVFRFSWSTEQIAEEVADVADGEAMAEALRPDLIAEVVAGGSEGLKSLFETALYPDVTHLKRIDLCVPESAIQPGVAACQGMRAIQSIGNVMTLGTGSTFDAEGRITTTLAPGSQITRGAWAGELHMFGCFLDLPDVKRYTIRYRHPAGHPDPGDSASDWEFVSQALYHVYIPAIGLPADDPQHKVGPFDTCLHVDGSATGQTVPAYKNIENDPQWVATHRLRKIRLNSQWYQSVLYDQGAGPVEFRIEGYDDAGNKVAAADDTIRLYIDNRMAVGDVDSVTLEGVEPDACALLEIPADATALTARFRVTQKGGFLQHYHFTATRGAGEGITITDPSQPLDVTYSEATYGDYFYGTGDGDDSDVDDYVVAEVQPSGGAWLPAEKPFCAFAFTLTATRRITDGYSLDYEHYLDTQLVGISRAPAPAPAS